MISMTRDEFWTYIEQCRQHSDNMPAFNRLLEAMLDTWEMPKIAAFHKVMWYDIGVSHDGGELWDIMYQAADYLGSADTWECYGGWLIAQGREFYEAVMRNPQVALTRVPPAEDVWEGESLIFVAQHVCAKKTGGKWGLYDLFGYDLSGKPLAGVDFPVTW
jgi:hypothetical protein